MAELYLHPMLSRALRPSKMPGSCQRENDEAPEALLRAATYLARTYIRLQILLLERARQEGCVEKSVMVQHYRSLIAANETIKRLAANDPDTSAEMYELGSELRELLIRLANE